MEITKAFNQAVNILPMAIVLWLCSAAFTESARVVVGKEGKLQENQNDISWCIAKPSSDEMKLQANIDYICGEGSVDCRVIRENGVCYYPNNVVSHASVVMNVYYYVQGRNSWNCYFNGTGLIINQDPNVGKPCVYV